MAEPSFTSGVLENGVWVTRAFSLKDALANNQRNQESPQSPEPDQRARIGMLTRTIIPSPIIYWIIPARIRGKQHNDVIFIGENFVTIKEVQADNRLKEVGTKRNFYGRIRHAKVLGESRLPAGALHFDSSDEHHGNGVSIPSESISNLGSSDGKSLPPQILVISLDSGELAFIFAKDTSPTSISFIVERRTILAQTSLAEQPGKQIAVDPKSRAMAVAAQKNLLVLYSLNSMDEMRTQFQKHARLDPVKEERIFLLKGIILRLEFLHPPDEDPSHIILLILVASSRTEIKFQIFEWDAMESLRHVRAEPEVEFPMDKDGDLPLLLIPLILSPSFLTVSETKISIWTGILHRSLRQDVTPLLPKRLRKIETPLWTQWARPVRNDGWSSKRDALYLAREDGLVHYIELDGKGRDGIPQVISEVVVGAFDCHIDTAFATLDMDASDDYVIAGGDLSSGSLMKITPRLTPTSIQSLHNWTAITDICVLPKSNYTAQYDGSPTSPSRNYRELEGLIACSGHKPHGTITQFRYGVNGRVMLRIDGLSRIERIWAWFSNDLSSVFILQSSAIETRLWLLTGISDDLDSTDIEEVDSTVCKSKFAQRTIAVMHVAHRSILITENEIYSLSMSSTDVGDTTSYDHYTSVLVLPDTHSIQMATVNEQKQLILCAISHASLTTLFLYQIELESANIINRRAESPVLMFVPTCLAMMNLNQGLYFVVSSSSAELWVYHMEENELKYDLKILTEPDTGMFDDASVCDSIGMLNTTHEDRSQSSCGTLLVCGLRNGDVLSYTIHFTNGSINIARRGRISFGISSVTLRSDDQYPNEILLHCGSEFCRLSFDENEPAMLKINRVWLSDVSEPWTQHQNTALSCRIYNPVGDKTTSDVPSLVSISEDYMYFLTLGHTPETIPRTLSINNGVALKVENDDKLASQSQSTGSFGATPRKILYSSLLDLLIVAYNKVDSQSQFVYASLRFFDPTSGYQVSFDTEFEGWQAVDGVKGQPTLGRPHERIMGMTEFFYDKAGSTGHYLVVFTGLVAPSDQHQPSTDAGRLIFLKISRPPSKNGMIEARERFVFKQRDPILGVVAIDTNVLAWASNSTIIVRVYDKDISKFGSPYSYELRSRICHLSASNLDLEVSTTSGSFHIISFDINTNSFSETFTRHPQPMHGTTQHLRLTASNYVLLSDHRLGKLEAVDISGQESNSTAAEAILPSSISKLALCAVRPSWKPKPHPNTLLQPEQGEREIIGTSLDGTIHQISLLSHEAWQACRFVENLARLSVDVELQRASVSQLDLHPSPDNSIETRVDGDFLAEEVVSFGIESFRKMIRGDSIRAKWEIGAKYTKEKAAAEEAWLGSLMLRLTPESAANDPISAAFEMICSLVQSTW